MNIMSYQLIMLSKLCKIYHITYCSYLSINLEMPWECFAVLRKGALKNAVILVLQSSETLISIRVLSKNRVIYMLTINIFKCG